MLSLTKNVINFVKLPPPPLFGLFTISHFIFLSLGIFLLEGMAWYASQLLAPAEGFDQGQGLFCHSDQKRNEKKTNFSFLVNLGYFLFTVVTLVLSVVNLYN